MLHRLRITANVGFAQLVFALPIASLRLSIYLVYLSVLRLLHIALLHYSLGVLLRRNSELGHARSMPQQSSWFVSLLQSALPFIPQAEALIMREERVRVCTTNARVCDLHANGDPVDIMRRAFSTSSWLSLWSVQTSSWSRRAFTWDVKKIQHTKN